MPKNECAFFKRHASDDSTVLDVGANFGTYCALYSRMAENARVIAFEPHPVTAGICRTNIELNKLSQIELVQKAVGKETGVVGFTDNGIPGTERIAFGSEARFEVPMIALDIFCKERSIDRIDFLKIDIEGAEYDALLGADHLFSSGRIRSGLIEISPSNLERFGSSTEDIREFFYQRDYKLGLCSSEGEIIESLSLVDSELPATVNAVFERRS